MGIQHPDKGYIHMILVSTNLELMQFSGFYQYICIPGVQL